MWQWNYLKVQSSYLKLKNVWQSIFSKNIGLVSWILRLRPNYISLHLPTFGEHYQQELQLRQIALQQAALLRPARPYYRAEDQEIIAEYQELAEADPLQFNTEQMYADLIAERQLAELLEAQATLGEWWQLASLQERQLWLARARQLQQSAVQYIGQ